MREPPSRYRPLHSLALALLLFAVTADALAVDYFSRGSGTWSSNGRWSTVACSGASAGGAEPSSAADTATICNGHTVTLDVNPTIGQLTVNAGGQLSMSNANANRTLTISTASALAGSVTNAGTIRFTNNNNQTLSVATTLGNTGTIDATAGVTGIKLIDVTGAITNSGTIQFGGNTNSFTVSTDVSLDNTGTISALAASTSTKTLTIGTSLTNGATGVISLGGTTNAMSMTVGTTVSNTGTIQGVAADGNAKNITVTGLFTNAAAATSILRLAGAGTMTVNLNGGLTNNATATVDGGTTSTGAKQLNVTGTLTNAGTVQFGGNTGNMTIAVTGAVSNSGTINALAASTSTKLLSMTTTLTNSGTVSLGGTTNAMSVTVGTTVTNSGTIQGVAADTNAKNFTATGLFTNSTAGAILRLQSTTGAITANLNGGLTNSGTVDGGAGGSDGIKTINVAGDIINNGGGVIQFGGNTNAMSIVVTGGGTLTNSGTVGALAASTSTKTLTVPGLITNDSGGVIRFGGTTNAMTINAPGGISNASGATFDVDTATTVNHVLNMGGTTGGGIANAGTFDLAPSTTALATANFTDTTADQAISGAGATTRFYRIIMTKGSKARVLEATATNFSLRNNGVVGGAGNGCVQIDSGTFRLSAGVTIDPFSNVLDADSGIVGNQAIPNGTPGYVLTANAGLHVNHPSAVVNISVGSTDHNLTLNGGTFRLTDGTVNIGDAANTRLRLANNAATTAQIEGGSLTISGRLTVVNRTDVSHVSISGGNILLNTVGNTDGAGFGAFVLGSGAGSTFTMSGGTITVQRADAAAANIEYEVQTPAAGANVTGGTVRLGNAATPAASTFQVRSDNAPIWNLVVDATTNTKTGQLNTSALTIANSLLIETGSTLDANTENIQMGSTTNAAAIGQWTNNGTFTPSTGTVTFQGANAGSSIGGSSDTTFNILTINKSSGNVALTVDARVTFAGNALVLTSGKIVAGSASNEVILGTGAVSSGASSASYVVGCVRKEYLAAAAGAFLFPIGDASNYTPITQTWNATAGANGDVTACVFTTDHPQVTALTATTAIDKDKSVNRYWTLTANLGGTGTPTGAYGASFVYVAGDNDGGATPANFLIQRYDGTVWHPITVSGTPTSTAAATTTTQTTGYGAFAIGEPIAGLTPGNPGRFNAFETSTPATAIIGKLFTKVSAVSGTVAIVAINSARNGLQAGPVFTGTVNVWVIDSSNNGGTLDANGCRTSWVYAGTATPVSPIGTPPAPDTTLTFVAGDNSRRNLTYTFPSNSYTSLRLMMRDAASGALIGCSGDVFALRPAGLLLEALDGDWLTAGTARVLNNTAASGGNVHAASTSAAGSPRPFTLRITAKDGASATTTNYAGTPDTALASGPTCVLPAGCASGTLTPSPLAWGAAVAGVRSASANYSEAGTFTMALQDSTFAAVDLVDGTPQATYTIPQVISTGPLVTGALEIGRFVPAYFDVTTSNTPQLQTFGSSCAARSFTYVGQSFGYVTPPVALVTAKNAAGGTTTNYRGALWKISTAGPSDVTQAYANNGVGPSLDTALANNAPAIDFSADNGTGTITVNSADRIAYVRDTTTPIVPYTANVSLTVSARDDAETGPVGNPAVQIASVGTALFNGGGSGIAFDAGAQFRYGRLRLQNATGSEKLDLNVPLSAQYYTATGFATNTADNCTSLVNDNFRFIATSYSGTLSAANLPHSRIQGAGTLSAGVGSLKVLKPNASVSGSVTMCIDLDPGASGDLSCQATAPGDKTWLQGPWGSATYTKDPPARLSFGVYGSQPRNFIFFRENY